MRARLLSLSLFACSGLLACGVEPAATEHTSTNDDPIVNGQNDSGHAGVVALTYQGQAFCSGTLVTPTVVVTASHCIFPGIGIDPPTDAQVFFGSDVSGNGMFIDVIEGEYNPAWSLDNPDADEDVAVLRLAEAAPVAPMPMANLPPVGTELTLVGFGITAPEGSGAGTKRFAHADIGETFPKVFSMDINPEGTCNGDSGGTAIWNDNGVEKFVGIHTRSDCQTFMLDERVDVHRADFIQPFIDQGGDCSADGACATGCTSPDPDCPCAADGFCTAACADVASDPDCNPKCAAEGHCVDHCPVPDPDCTDCDADGNCNAACASDPDCEPSDGGAGGGESSSGGHTRGGGDSNRPVTITTCGCNVPGGEPAGAPFMAAALLGFAFGARRIASSLRRRGAPSSWRARG